MQVKENKIKGVFEIDLSPHIDSRGFFMRTYDIKQFRKAGLHKEWVQENHSKSMNKDIIRGLHLQLPPFCETKMIRCINGAILDVFVDLRKNSKTFGQWGSYELSEENKKIAFIPRGFAHGFCTLTEQSEVIYKVDNYYSRQHEIGLLWSDPDIAINWPIENPVLSEKDKNNITLHEFNKRYKSIDI